MSGARTVAEVPLAALIRRLRDEYDHCIVSTAILDAATALSRYQRLLTAAREWAKPIQGMDLHRDLLETADGKLLAAIEEASR